MYKPPQSAFEMELPERPGPRIQYRRPWIWRVGIVAAIVVIVAIVVPLAVIIPRKKGSQAPPSSVIFPLYINPNTNGWDPLYSAINSTTSLNFTVVINPNNGPGTSDLPDTNYIASIKTLNAYSNVRVIGYVHTSYANRSIDQVLADVSVYNGWPSKSSGLHVDGIFFDEAPHIYSSDAASYMAQIDAAVKNSTGIQHEKTTIHNPGVVPDPGLSNANTDITIAFEDSYTTYGNRQSILASLPDGRTHYGFIIHSVPTSVSLGSLVYDMAQRASYLFITNLDTDYYESFGSDWSSFVDAMPS